MASNLGDLVVNLGAKSQSFDRQLDRAKGSARTWVSDVTAIFAGLSIAGAASSIVGFTKDLALTTVRLAADAETASVQFGVLAGSAEKAAAVIDDLNKFAAETPFESMEINAAARQLMSFGFASESVVGELRTLGDLSAGMQIPLGELADLYGKAKVQGRLFMEDINQLQGRGINVTAELAKEFGNVREAVEKGQVNFEHLQKALKAMTSEGGGFFQMMVKMAETFDGQLSTLVDNVKAIGRSIGEMILPPLKDIVSETNNVLAKFNELPDKMEFLGNVFEASFDVAFETIKLKWDVMLADMLSAAKQFALDSALEIAMPGGMAAAAGFNAGAGAQDRGAGNLDAANARLQGLLKQVKPDAKGPAEKVAPANDPIDQAQKRFDDARKAATDFWLNDPAMNAAEKALDSAKDKHGVGSPEWMKADKEFSTQMRRGRGLNAAEREASVALEKAKKEPQIREGGEKMKSGVASLWESLQAPIAEAQMAAEGIWDRTKIKAGAAMGTLENIFTGETKTEPEKKIEPRLAGAMQKGSSEAYSTIVQAMLTRGKDPVVRATEKQTKDLIKGLKPAMAPPAMLVAFSEL